MDKQGVVDVNTIASFLANEETKTLSEIPDIDTIVLCGSAILHCAETVFSALRRNPHLAKTLVISGGIGHSTQFLYDAVMRHPKYHNIKLADARGGKLAESRVLYNIFEEFYDARTVRAAGHRVLIDDVSTNCGANASETLRILQKYNVSSRKLVIVQDPTMSRRTLATFQKTYAGLDAVPTFVTVPTFTPRLEWTGEAIEYDIPGLDTRGLWDTRRFCELVLGEVPRMRDDAHGYGPKGKGFITHVDIPEEVERAWTRVNKVVLTERVKALKG